MNHKHHRKAWEWMNANPRAYELFKQFANEMASTGQHFGATLIAERIRWECRLKKIGEFKWNNNHTTYVAHRWADEHPQYAHLIQFRSSVKEYQPELF